MNLYSCTNISIKIDDSSSEIEKEKSVDDESIIIAEWASFIIEKSGVYVLEGANRSGKSILIKMIMGILPPNVESNKYSQTLISNSHKEINSINDAFSNGLVAVFQDDTLISTMTILEQIKLRHTPTPSFKNYLSNFIYRFWKKISGVFEYNMIIDEIASSIERNADEKLEKAFPEKVVEYKCKELLKQFPNLKEDVLYKYPHQLSGGTLAKIKIINAQLSNNIKILFLDEALNAVGKDDCDLIIEQIKNWAEEKSVCVVVVTHKQDEIFKWQPKGRYLIQNKEIIHLDKTKYDALDYGIQLKNDFIVKYYSISKAKSLLENLDSPVLVLIDEFVKNLAPTNEIFEYLRKKEKKIIYLKIDESKKNLNEYTKLIPEVLSYMEKIDGTIIIIGGGVIINFGAFIAATLHRGLIPYILVPTTVMAIADVAIGSKASLNVLSENSVFKKHVLGIYTTPSSVIIDIEYIKNLTNLEKKIGLSECLKQGLIQDDILFEKTLDLINAKKPNSENILEVAIRTQELKSRTLINDPFEMKYGSILLFGHLHAHSLECLTNYKIVHGISVYWGMILDLKLLNKMEIADKIIKAIKDSEIINNFRNYFETIQDKVKLLNELKAIYNSNNKIQYYKSKDKYNIVKLETIGQYKKIGCKIENVTVDWDNIRKEVINLIDELKN